MGGLLVKKMIVVPGSVVCPTDADPKFSLKKSPRTGHMFTACIFHVS